MRRTSRLPLESLVPFLYEQPDPPVPFDVRTVFGNDNPLEIEVGFGKGLFLLTAATAHPEVNYLGIEVLRKYQLLAATRLARQELTNVRLAKADARQFLRAAVADGSVQAVHVYFPDPWWKTRHHKRRVFTEEFAAQCERVLRPGGILSLATDVEAYFQVMTELLAPRTAFRLLSPPPEKPPEHDLDYLTNFERKFRKEGRAIYRAQYQQNDDIRV